MWVIWSIDKFGKDNKKKEDKNIKSKNPLFRKIRMFRSHILKDERI